MEKRVKIGLVSLGCPKNLVDSENMLGILKEQGYTITLDADNADIVLINTCSFIKEAETESVRTILAFVQAGKQVVVTGCLPQKHQKDLQEAIPEVAGFAGTGDYQKIGEIIKNLSEKNTVFEVSKDPNYEHFENIKRFHITAGAGSYIKIAEGCNYSCGFCIIPALKGKYNSRSIESIVKEACALGREGLSEVILIAQDTTSYGKDIYGKPSLERLLEELNDIDEISWIRPMYFYPTSVDDKLLDAMARLEKVVKYVDIPLQHSHPDVLKLMKRPVVDNGALIERIREKVPGVAIRTAFITGYPGETEEHFEHLYNFIEKYKFDKLGVFEYSKEKNTASYSLKGHVPARTKKSRKHKLMSLQQGISRAINESLIGKEIPSIIETITPDGIEGRTYRDAPEVDGLIQIKTDEILNPGDIVNVKVTAASEYDLFGKV